MSSTKPHIAVKKEGLKFFVMPSKPEQRSYGETTFHKENKVRLWLSLFQPFVFILFLLVRDGSI